MGYDVRQGASGWTMRSREAPTEAPRSRRRVANGLLALMLLTAVGCTIPAPGKAAMAPENAAETCEERFKGKLDDVVTYSRVVEGADYTLRVDLCQGEDFGKAPYDPNAIPLQIDEYSWEPESGSWRLVEGSPRTVTGSCASFTESVNIGVAALVEQLLCSDRVSPEEEMVIFRKISHDESQACWTCFDHENTVFFGTVGRSVYCQVPDYDRNTNRRVHLDSYKNLQFQYHIGTYNCPNVSGLLPDEVDKLCEQALPELPACH